jgi:hypothetical protein
VRVVIGVQALADPGGTETHVATEAHELERLGHDVIVTAEELGAVAGQMRAAGTRVAHTPLDLPTECDAVLAHDAPSTAALAERYPEARLVFVAHTDRSDYQVPVLIPGTVDAIVACSERLAARMRAFALDVPIVRMREPIDTQRFARNGALPERPRRALVLSNYLDGARFDALADAWGARGVECVRLGEPQRELDPRPAIREADIVVAKARAALEAMCCGRAVYVYDQFGGDGWVTADSYPRLEADHFAGQSSPHPRAPDDLARDLDDYSPDMGRANNELIRKHHRANRHATELVSVLRGPSGRRDGTSALAEVGRLTRTIWRAEHHTVGLEHQNALLHERAVSAEAEREAWRGRAVAAEHRVAELEGLLGTRRARTGIAIGRVLDRARGRR